MRQIVLFSPFYKWGTWETERFSNLPEVTQLGNHGARIQTKAICTQRSILIPTDCTAIPFLFAVCVHMCEPPALDFVAHEGLCGACGTARFPAVSMDLTSCGHPWADAHLVANASCFHLEADIQSALIVGTMGSEPLCAWPQEEWSGQLGEAEGPGPRMGL